MSPPTILFNARCPICAAEIAHYRSRCLAVRADLRFIDLHAADLPEWGLSPDQAKRRLHARLPDGRQVSGLAAFEVIWDHLPGFKWLARATRIPVLRPAVAFAYDRIAAPALYHLHRRRERLGKAQPRA